jgi:hypothetical protein
VLVRHNTTLLEKAITLVVERAAIGTRQAEAEAVAKRARAVAHRRLATGTAIALAAAGIGLGVMLGLWRPTEHWATDFALPSSSPQISTTETVPTPAPSPHVEAGRADDRAAAPLHTDQHDVVINYSKFATQSIDFLGRKWDIEAGHQYAIETDKIWKVAWCYSNPIVDGVQLRVDLASRLSPTAKPMALVASRESLTKVGLDDTSARELATKCPWIDGKTFGVDDFSIPTGRIEDVVRSPVAPPSEERLAAAPVGLPLDVSTVAPAPDVVGTANFAAKDGFDSPGNDLPNMPIESDDQWACANSCRDEKACSAYTFNKTFKKCFLKSGSTVLFSNASAAAGYRTDRGIAPKFSQLQMHPSKSFAGDIYRRDGGVRYIDCVMQCESDSNCKAFSHDSKAKLCLLFKVTTGEIDTPNFSSGVKAGG